jgi:hypothetical protein
MNTRRLLAAAPAIACAVACLAGGCSVTPTYEVRVVNDSPMTVQATLTNARNLVRQEVIAEARLAPNSESVLGPVEAAPLDPVELRVARPEDMAMIPARTRLSRGRWTAVVSDAGDESWSPLSVRVTRD